MIVSSFGTTADASVVVSVETVGASTLPLRFDQHSDEQCVATVQGTYLSFLGSSTTFRTLTPSANLLTSSVALVSAGGAATVGAAVVEVEASGRRAASGLLASTVAVGAAAVVLEGVASVCTIASCMISMPSLRGRHPERTLWTLSFFSGEDEANIPVIRAKIPFFSCKDKRS